MPDTDKLVTELIEVRKQAQALLDRVELVLESIEGAPPSSKREGPPLQAIDFVVDYLQLAKKPVLDSELIAAVLPEVKKKVKASPEVQAWKSLQFHITHKGVLAAVKICDGKLVETEFNLRSDRHVRRREFPGNLIALREWITQE